MTSHTESISDNFDAYWDEVDNDLAKIDPRPELTPLPMRSNEYSTVYALKLTSIGPARVFGYYSVPTGDGGPFPTLMQTPSYGSVNHIPDYNDRKRYVCLTIMHRGQRLADEPWAARYPGLLTEGLDTADTYIYRSIVADCLRGAEFLLSREEVDPARIAIAGDHLAMLTATRRTGFTHMVAEPGLLYRPMEARLINNDYPLEEFNDYFRSSPEKVGSATAVLELFDPINHVKRFSGSTLLTTSGSIDWYQPIIDAFGGGVEVYERGPKSGTDADNIDAWLAQTFNVAPMSRFIREFSSSSPR